MDAFRKFLQHHLFAGCSDDESILSLVYLVREISTPTFHYGNHKDLIRAIPDFAEFCKGITGET
jgi:hypothetical protein